MTYIKAITLTAFIGLINFAMLTSCKLSKKSSGSVKAESNGQTSEALPVEYTGTFRISDTIEDSKEVQSTVMRFTLTFDFNNANSGTFIAEPTQENGLKINKTNLIQLERKTVRGSGLFFRMSNFQNKPNGEQLLAINFEKSPFDRITSLVFGNRNATEIEHNDAVKDAKKSDFFKKTSPSQNTVNTEIKIATGLFLTQNDRAKGSVTSAAVLFNDKNNTGKLIVLDKESGPLQKVSANPLNGESSKCICTLLADSNDKLSVS